MNKLINIFCTILVLSELVIAQEYMVYSPEHLAFPATTSRIGNSVFSNSSLAQSFYSHNAQARLSVYVPQQQLTDATLSTNALNFISPSYSWGMVQVGYAAFEAQNFRKPVLTSRIVQAGVAQQFFQRFVVGILYKWSQTEWYSDTQASVSHSGNSLDISGVFIINGFSSAGFTIENAYRSGFSSLKNDAPAQTFRAGYTWDPNDRFYSVEGGIILTEDAFFDEEFGGYINTLIQTPYNISLGAEYRRLQYNELGAFVNYTYVNETLQATLSYAVRIDDYPFPVSSIRHAFGVSFSLNSFRPGSRVVNPQHIYRDRTAPDLLVERLSDYTVLTNSDGSDLFAMKLNCSDDQAGLKSIRYQIESITDSTEILFSENKSNIRSFFHADTLRFNGMIGDSLLANKSYCARIIAEDNAGNRSKSDAVPFRILSASNDSIGPVITLSFDSTATELSATEKNHMLNAHVSIDDSNGDWVLWRVQLYKVADDSSWHGLRPVTGSVEINKRNFQWLLRNNSTQTIAGTYKVKVEANDELKNYTLSWSAPKTIVQEVVAVPEAVQPIASRNRQQRVKVPEQNTVVMFAAAEPVQSSPDALASFTSQASYLYRGREIRLTDFVFNRQQAFDPNTNRQSLSVLGVYMQDLPQAQLVIEFPGHLSAVNKFETNLKSFMLEAFGIMRDRIQFKESASGQTLHFIINEISTSGG